MRRAVAAGAAGLAMMAVGAPALAQDVYPWGAGPKGLANHRQLERFVCEFPAPRPGFLGDDIHILSAGGRMGWDFETGDKYLLLEISSSGTYTPAGGVPQQQSFTKVYGGGPQRGAPLDCTALINDTDADGNTFVGQVDITVVTIGG